MSADIIQLHTKPPPKHVWNVDPEDHKLLCDILINEYDAIPDSIGITKGVHYDRETDTLEASFYTLIFLTLAKKDWGKHEWISGWLDEKHKKFAKNYKIRMMRWSYGSPYYNINHDPVNMVKMEFSTAITQLIQPTEQNET